MSDLSNALSALRIANKRIDELEKYNLDLANESHNKSARIEKLQQRVGELEEERDALAEHSDLLMGAAKVLRDQEIHSYREIGEACDYIYRSLKSTKNSLAEHDAKLFEFARVPKHAKAGCIGEFEIIEENANICPECVRNYSPGCTVCMGESDENGACDLVVNVPWNMCKEIWKAMNKIKAEEIRRAMMERKQ